MYKKNKKNYFRSLGGGLELKTSEILFFFVFLVRYQVLTAFGLVLLVFLVHYQVLIAFDYEINHFACIYSTWATLDHPEH